MRHFVLHGENFERCSYQANPAAVIARRITSGSLFFNSEEK